MPKWLIAIYHPGTNWDNDPTELGQKSEKIAQLKWGKNLKKLPSLIKRTQYFAALYAYYSE